MKNCFWQAANGNGARGQETREGRNKRYKNRVGKSSAAQVPRVSARELSGREKTEHNVVQRSEINLVSSRPNGSYSASYLSVGNAGVGFSGTPCVPKESDSLWLLRKKQKKKQKQRQMSLS